jgi:hypothetical protein
VVRKNSIRALLGVDVSKSRPVTMLQGCPHAIHFKRTLNFGEGQYYFKRSKIEIKLLDLRLP